VGLAKRKGARYFDRLATGFTLSLILQHSSSPILTFCAAIASPLPTCHLFTFLYLPNVILKHDLKTQLKGDDNDNPNTQAHIKVGIRVCNLTKKVRQPVPIKLKKI
jgi:hypothetical protein